MRTLYIICLLGGEGQVFFDEKFNLISIVWANDGDWRDEYFNPILEHFGIKVKQLKTPPDSEELNNALLDYDEEYLVNLAKTLK